MLLLTHILYHKAIDKSTSVIYYVDCVAHRAGTGACPYEDHVS
jgi:hypothetical protein